MKDRQAPSKTQLEIGAKAIETVVNSGEKVYVHCQNGYGRAPTLVVVYFISQGKTLQEAIDLVKSKRLEIHLTDRQLEALKIFEKGEIEKEPCC